MKNPPPIGEGFTFCLTDSYANELNRHGLAAGLKKNENA